MKTTGQNKALLWSLVLFAIAACFFIVTRLREKAAPSPDPSRPSLSIRTFETGNGWGYRIFANDTALVIEQDIIPTMPGRQGFASEEKALKTGKLVVEKLEKGRFPPSVTKEELRGLGVIP